MNDFGSISKWIVEDRRTNLTYKTDPNVPGDEDRLTQFILKLNTSRVLGSVEPSQSLTKISDVTSNWKSYIENNIGNEKTVDEYVSKVKVFASYVKNMPINQISKKHVSDFLSMVASGKMTGAILSNASINKYICALNSFFEQTRREGAWPDNQEFPTRGQRFKKGKSKSFNSYKPFTSKDLQRIFKNSNLLDWAINCGQLHEPHMSWLSLLGLFLVLVLRSYVNWRLIIYIKMSQKT